MPLFHCSHSYQSGHRARWAGNWEVLSIQTDFHELRIKARGSSFDVVLGYCSSGYYLCIPTINIGCALNSWADVFWNMERLTPLLNETDAVTIATAIYDYGSSP